MLNNKVFLVFFVFFGLFSGCSTHKLYEPQVYLDGYTTNLIKYHYIEDISYKKKADRDFKLFIKSNSLKNKKNLIK